MWYALCAKGYVAMQGEPGTGKSRMHTLLMAIFAYAWANRSRYGLAAYVFTNDLAAAMRAYERLEFGMIGVNEWAPHATEAPFAGRKDSGVGHEGGREGLLDNLETKLVSFGGVA